VVQLLGLPDAPVLQVLQVQLGWSQQQGPVEQPLPRDLGLAQASGLLLADDE